MKTNNKNYLTCLIVLACLFGFFNAFFIFFNIGTTDGYLLPFAGKLEWIFNINMTIVTILLCGIIALYVVMPAFLKLYVKSIGKKQQIGLVPEKQLSGKNHLLKIWLRGIVLGFFISNLAFTLVSNQNFILAMMTPTEESRLLSEIGYIPVPDPTLMMLLLWIIAIPCTIIVVPIWFMIDVGLAAVKKVKGFEFSSVNLAASFLYKIIKGYAGIGFAYNLFMMIYEWIARSNALDVINIVAQILSPLAIITSTFPLIILMDNQKGRFKAKLEKTLIKLDLNKDLKSNVELVNR